jgi:hypothetical protein
MIEPLETRAYTFGLDSIIKGLGVARHYVVISAPTAEQCRESMLSLCGQDWAMEYPTEEDVTRRNAGYRRFALVSYGIGATIEHADHPGVPYYVRDLAWCDREHAKGTGPHPLYVASAVLTGERALWCQSEVTRYQSSALDFRTRKQEEASS